MSEQTNIPADSVRQQKEEFTETPVNSQKAKMVATVAGGVAVGVGAVAVDAYAENEKLTGDEVETPENTVTADSTDAATDSAEVVADPAVESPTPEVVTDTTGTDLPPVPPANSAPTPEWHADSTAVTMIPDNVTVVNAPDSMAFGDAFNAVRNEAGPGALFEWHGNLYHTYHPDEFASLPHEMKEVYEALWLADQSHTDGIEVVPENEGGSLVYTINVENADQSPATENTPEQVSDTTDSSEIEYVTYSDEPITEEEYDNDYEGADDFMNPEDLA